MSEPNHSLFLLLALQKRGQAPAVVVTSPSLVASQAPSMGPNNKKKKNKQRTKKPPPDFSVEEWTEAASVALANQEVDTALALYTAALDAQEKVLQANDNSNGIKRNELVDQRVSLLDKRAEVKTTLGDPDGAREDYQTALQLHQTTETLESNTEWYERTASLYLYIGQTSTGRDAVAAYEKALAILETCLGQCQKVNSTAAIEITQQLASVCCNAAEVYLTDLCEQADAEQQCEQWVQKALTFQIPVSDKATDETRPTVDALQLLANLRISQCRASEALPAILEAFQQIEGPCRSLAHLVDVTPTVEEGVTQEDQAMELSQVDAVQALPGFEFRCQMVKIMLEAAAVSENADDKDRVACRQAAIYVLGSLMAENDEVVEIWVLLGDAFQAISCHDEAVSYWQNALDMLGQLKQSIEEDMQMSTSMLEDDPEADQREDEMQQQMDEVMCQMDDLDRKIAELKAPKCNDSVFMQE